MVRSLLLHFFVRAVMPGQQWPSSLAQSASARSTSFSLSGRSSSHTNDIMRTLTIASSSPRLPGEQYPPIFQFSKKLACGIWG
jgi:hypothetical protein